MAPVLLTIVRHGESTDNTKSLWAGSRDAPLSVHGMNQARASGAHHATTPITAIYASPLLRARWTGEQIHEQNKASSLPPITFSPLLQEQHFGDAEGQSWLQGWSRGDGRDWSFKNGESLNDVGRRADEAIDTFLLPHLNSDETEEQHVYVVAHGIFNSELVGALLRRRTPEAQQNGEYIRAGGMTNTGFHRIHLTPIPGSSSSSSASSPSPSPSSLSNPPSPPSTSTTAPANPSSIPAAPVPTTPSPSAGPHLKIRIISLNNTPHLDGLKRQGEGIGSSAYDAKQQKLRDFFSGGGST